METVINEIEFKKFLGHCVFLTIGGKIIYDFRASFRILF